MEKKYPRVGIGVMIKNDQDQVLLGLRRGSHGANEWAFPGGHLEFGEKFFETAKRELMEETGLQANDFKLISVADEMRYIESDGKHYLNIGVLAKYENGEARLLEPDKFKEWRWFSITEIPENLFEGTALILEKALD